MKSSPRVAVTRFFFNPFTAALAADPAMEPPVVVDMTMMRVPEVAEVPAVASIHSRMPAVDADLRGVLTEL